MEDGSPSSDRPREPGVWYCVACAREAGWIDERMVRSLEDNPKQFIIFRRSVTTRPADPGHFLIHGCLKIATLRLGREGHVSAAQLLAAVPEAAEQIFGDQARAELRQLGITSSKTFGGLVYRCMGAGIVAASPGDQEEDFDVTSPLDDFLA